ncbi:MAG TPA: hypothetical protein VGL64_25955 [Amycolatopsis sp.]
MFTVKAIMGRADLEELTGYVQRAPEARAKLLASRGEHNALTVIDGVGQRGTNRDNQTLPDAPSDDVTDVS